MPLGAAAGVEVLLVDVPLACLGNGGAFIPQPTVVKWGCTHWTHFCEVGVYTLDALL